MRAIVIPRHGGPDVLEVREMPDLHPKAGEVRIRVRAAGLNFAELMARQGLYPDAPKPPMVVGYEVAGEVDELGEGVTAHAVGARVVVMCRFGGHAEQVCVPAEQAHAMPDAMTFEEAAALPVNYLTAHHMLFHVGALKPGESVLVHMAAGGVGLAVLQLCRTVENVTVFGTASKSKHDVLRQEGCTHPIDYRNDDYVAEVKRLTNERGVDVVLDALGGADWKKGYHLLKPAGRLIAFGFSNMSSGGSRKITRVASQFLRIPLFNPMSLMSQNRAVAGVNMGHLWHAPEIVQPQFARLLELYRQGSIKPRIDATFPFDKVADAHHRIESRQNVGKVVLVP